MLAASINLLDNKMVESQEHDSVRDDRKLTADFSIATKMYFMPTGLQLLPFVEASLQSTAK
jgi:hypothetical protein